MVFANLYPRHCKKTRHKECYLLRLQLSSIANSCDFLNNDMILSGAEVSLANREKLLAAAKFQPCLWDPLPHGKVGKEANLLQKSMQ